MMLLYKLRPPSDLETGSRSELCSSIKQTWSPHDQVLFAKPGKNLRLHHLRGGGRLTTDHARTVSTACAQRLGHHEPAVRRSTVPSAQRSAQVTLRCPGPQHHFRFQHSVDAESMLQDDHLPITAIPGTATPGTAISVTAIPVTARPVTAMPITGRSRPL